MAVKELRPSEVAQRLRAGEAELVDIRDAEEHHQLRIPDARWAPLSGLEAGLAFAKPGKDIGVFHCNSGFRTRKHVDKLQQLGYAEVYLMRGGITAWKKAGLPVTSDHASRSVQAIMRQVQVIAGSLVALGVVLGVAVDARFLWLSGLVGAGLVYAGASGSCMMAMLLAKLPFNR